MPSVFLTTFILLIVGGISVWLILNKRRKRATILARPLPNDWRNWLEKDFPRYRTLPDEIKKTLDGYLQVLIEEKRFEACGDLDEVTDRMKVLIAAQAALLLVRLKKYHFYRRLKSILVYPTAFRDGGHRRFGLQEERGNSVNLGESWQTGSIILAWDSVIAGARNSDDGQNVVFHEFAHQLDQIDGAADGLPILGDRKAYAQWAETFLRNYDDLVKKVESGKGRRSIIDSYGATNPAEFFAVASETFFEEPQKLLEKRSDLYGQLKNFYGLDPAAWIDV